MSGADFRVGEIPLALLSCPANGVPHLPQKFEPDKFSAPHFAHARASGLPHLAQKLLSAGFSQSHVGQSISRSLSLNFTERPELVAFHEALEDA